MGWTKRQFITQAFTQIGLGFFVHDLKPEQLEKALFNLDAMMSTWDAEGIQIGYPLTSSPDESSLDTETEVFDFAHKAIYMNLALEIADTIGKVVSPELKIQAKNAYDTLLMKMMAFPREKKFQSTLPAGAGNKIWRYRRDPFLEPN